MRRWCLHTNPRRSKEIRDIACKKHGNFVCASPQYGYFCNADHTKRGWGVGARRMERGCRIKKLESVQAFSQALHQQGPEIMKIKTGARILAVSVNGAPY